LCEEIFLINYTGPQKNLCQVTLIRVDISCRFLIAKNNIASQIGPSR